MIGRLAFVGLFLLAAAPAHGQTAAELGKAHCAAEWPGDYVMQKWCYEQQATAGVALQALIKENPSDTEGGRILYRCFKQWPGKAGHLVDYTMALWCARQQLAAYKALQ